MLGSQYRAMVSLDEDHLAGRAALYIKSRLLPAKRWALWAPDAWRYYAAVRRRAPLEELIKLMPTAHRPRVYWTELQGITYNGLIEISRQGRQFCSGNYWEFPEAHLRPSIFDDVPQNVYRWSIHRTVRMIFVEGRSHRETPQYASIMEQMEQSPGSVVWGCRTIEDVDRLFLRMRKAYESMREHGYLTQTELGRPSGDEIPLYVAQDGKLLKGIGGNHRVLMAELLGIRWIPFVLRGCHHEWLQAYAQAHSLSPHLAVARWLKGNKAIRDSRPADHQAEGPRPA